MRLRAVAFAAVFVPAVLASEPAAAGPRALSVRRVALDLPGPPATIVTTDLDGDGRADLVVATAAAQWGSIAKERIENAVEVTDVVPALFDRREARAFLARPGGAYESLPPLTIPKTWIALARGTAAWPLLVLTDDGISGVAWKRSEAGGAWTVVPLVDEPSAFAGGGALLSELKFLEDVDRDGRADALIPGRDGLAVHRADASGALEREASQRVRLPGDLTRASQRHAQRSVPLPQLFDVDGDGKKDLVVAGLSESPQTVHVARGTEAGRFAPFVKMNLACLAAPPAKPAADDDDSNGPPQESRRVAWIGDLEGDGRMEIVTRESVDTGKSDRKQAMAPLMRYRFHHVRPDLSVDPAPYTTLDAEGYAFSGAFRDGVDLEFLDLDGDGRKDLVTVTVDVSVWQMLRALTSKKLSIGLEFRVFSQGADGVFRKVPDQVLDEKLSLDLNHVEISRLGEFRGDFDGDGKVDFVHLGRGKKITIHRGLAGGKYPEKPDLEIELDEEPEDVLLVRVGHFDGDGRSDIAITRTRPSPEAGASALATLELYLSGEGK